MNGVATAIGPGRGDVNVGAKNHTTFDTLDLTSAAQAAQADTTGKLVLALQCYHHDGTGQVILELRVTYGDGSEVVVGTDGGGAWKALDATPMFNPSTTSASHGYAQPLEDMDATSAAYAAAGDGWGWRDDAAFDDSHWVAAVEQKGGFGYVLKAKTTVPLELTTGVPPARIVTVSAASHHYFFDFGTDFMGGLRIEIPVTDGIGAKAGAGGGVVLSLKMSEELCNVKDADCGSSVPLSNYTVKVPMRTGNIFENTWTASSSSSSPSSSGKLATKTVVFEHHEYMLFRYGELTITGLNAPTTPRPAAAAGSTDEEGTSLPFTLTAWTVRYPWVDADSSFDSPDPMLNAVYELSRNTIKVTSLDTTTDSNTRERLPYEADGLITGASRAALQRNAMSWNHHSFKNNFENPTWPTEWRQILPLAAQADYIATGDPSLAVDNWDYLLASTQLPCLSNSTGNSRGLVDFSGGCKRSCAVAPYPLSGCKDIVDWPSSQRDGYQFTDINTVINAYTVGGLDALAQLANVSGRPAGDAARLTAAAASLRAAMNAKLWGVVPGHNGTFSDGLDPAKAGAPAIGHASFHSAAFPLFFDVADSAEKRADLLVFLKTKRMAGSVYSAYAFLLGLYHSTGDHGMFALDILTTCDTNSWCSMLRAGATATMEAWTRPEKPNLSWSHPWASAPASAVTTGLMGVTPSAPGFKRFTVRPQPGRLSWATVRVPTLAGYINAAFNATAHDFALSLAPPAGTLARVCLPALGGAGDLTLLVDGKKVEGVADGDYVCVEGIGSGSAARTVRRTTSGRVGSV